MTVSPATSCKCTRHHPWDSARGFSYVPPSGLRAHICQCDCFSSRVPPSVITRQKRYRNINLLSIDYAFRPRLRVRLTLGGFTVPRNPWVYGEQDSHLLYRYLSRHYLFQNVQESLPSPFTRLECSPTSAENKTVSCNPKLRLCTLAPFIFGAEPLDQ